MSNITKRYPLFYSPTLVPSYAVKLLVYKNLTKDLVIDRPFQVLSSDISYIRTGEGDIIHCK